jgi:glutathione synthase/RimK-type ligase-like ATP-grasp enzyme
VHDIQDRLILMRALRAIEARLAAEPDAVVLRFDRARCLEALGNERDALHAYRDVLALDPGHVRAMNAFGLLLLRAQSADEAEIVFREAVRRHPGDAASHTNLAFACARRGDRAAARAAYETALRLDPTSALAHHGLAAVLAALGEDAAARAHRAQGFAQRPITALRYRGSGTPVRVLALGTGADGNVSTERLLDEETFFTYALAVEHHDPSAPLPPHDLIFNLIGEADACARELAAAERLVRASGAPVINPPRAVLATGREANARRLGALADVVAPATARLTRVQLAQRELRFPLLLRTPGFHGGDHFVRVDAAGDLADALARLPGEELLAIAFLDSRGADGAFRKYRAMIVDGRLYPLHLAIGPQWKLHYFSAEMAGSPERRAEEAAFLADLRAHVGARAYAALERIRDALALDYGGIDFGLAPDGRVLLFEANATMVVPAPERDPRFAYRRTAVERILTAVRAMLLARAGRVVRPG